MVKRFESPIGDTLDPILLDAALPNPQRISKNFHLVASTTGGTVSSSSVSDWHEEILTHGFEWVLPGDTRFPQLFPAGQSLITKNGDFHF